MVYTYIMKPFRSYLKQHRTVLGLSKTDLANKVSVSPSYLMQIENGQRNPPTATLCLSIADALRLSDEDKKEFLKAAYSERTKEATEEFKAAGVIDPESPNQETLAIPVIGIIPAADIGVLEGNALTYVNVDSDQIKDRDAFALVIKGNCLKDARICDGDTIIVSRSARVDEGSIAVVRVGDQCTCKKVHIEDDKLILERINADDPKKFIIDPCKEDVNIIGRVVWSMRKH